MRAVPLLAAAVLFAAAATAQPILLSGTIGKAPVFLDLDRTGDTVSGWYFYLKVGKQIRLDGKLDPNGLFDIQEYTASTNSRTGSFKGHIKNGRWTGTWTDAAKKKSYAVTFAEVRGTLKDADGRLVCAVRTHDEYGNRSHQSLDLTLKGGRVKGLTMALTEKPDGGDQQGCHLDLADLKQVPTGAGILLKARKDRPSGEHHCTVRLFAAGDYLVARVGDTSQANDDCRGAGATMFCSPRAFWLGLAVNRKTQVCKQVK
ncbi:hypothetical protein [Rhizomicrobium electricum]|uniref:DUF3108 domain-containing protein n=1 Tax=Rhizomicrobium electricum TaxID=480070 RepID=A0ABP3P3L6_9PROT|nr:hypothetical protein [Rhizomicrobium electricum]NIJ47611.1 hypothetical protein [Rhizomicrobium electricum]